MKKIFLFFASLTIGSASMVSCNDLSEETYSVIPSDKFFNDEEEFLMSAGRIYAYLVRYTCYRCIWGTIRETTMVTMMGKMILSVLDTVRSCFITTVRSFLVVSAFIMGGWITGTRAM